MLYSSYLLTYLFPQTNCMFFKSVLCAPEPRQEICTGMGCNNKNSAKPVTPVYCMFSIGKGLCDIFYIHLLILTTTLFGEWVIPMLEL